MIKSVEQSRIFIRVIRVECSIKEKNRKQSIEWSILELNLVEWSIKGQNKVEQSKTEHTRVA